MFQIRVRVSVYLFHFTNEQFFLPCCLGVLFWVLVMRSKKLIGKIFERLETSPPHKIDLVMVFDAILTSRQTHEKLQCLYENLMPNNFRRTAALKKYDL